MVLKKDNNAKKFLILMNGYTGVGKSTLAKWLSDIFKADIYHSAIVRKQLRLTPQTKKEADAFFDYRTGLRKEVDKQVYEKLAENAFVSLKKGKNVILDGAYPFNWQRQKVYHKMGSLGTEIFVIRVICDDDKEIKKRLNIRSENFGSSPFHETPSWNTYIAIKEVTEPLEKDLLSDGKILNIIEYDSLTRKVRLIQGYKNSENMEKIMGTLLKDNESV